VTAKRDGAAIVGIGAACAVCCAGPILGFLAAIGLGTAVGFALFGVSGLVIALAIGLVLYLRRRRRSSMCTPAPEVVEVEPPRIRTSR
jgi:mercuric ion transport protein